MPNLITSTITYASSLRAVPVCETLRHAQLLAPTLGITRVTDVTRLDHIGIPVCVSIRPAALRGSLCVNAGKGVTLEDAQVGAYMEAIEYAMAEPGRSHVFVTHATVRDVLRDDEEPESILDFCPRFGVEIPLSSPLPWVDAEEILSGDRCFVPADTVFLPSEDGQYFGSGANGLASGNTILEATVHGLAEAIERDIQAFACVRDTSVRVDHAMFPMEVRRLANLIQEAGLDLYVRATFNAFGLPYFMAVIADRDSRSPLYINAGYGCHPHRSIALIRAICEAAQSRLSFIHGGRDDLRSHAQMFKGMDDHAKSHYIERLILKASGGTESISFCDVPDYFDEANSLSECYEILASSIERIGLSRICRVCFTRPEDPLQVVKIIVPGLEHYDPTDLRVGPRLRDYVEQL